AWSIARAAASCRHGPRRAGVAGDAGMEHGRLAGQPGPAGGNGNCACGRRRRPLHVAYVAPRTGGESFAVAGWRLDGLFDGARRVRPDLRDLRPVDAADAAATADHPAARPFRPDPALVARWAPDHVRA